MAAASAKKSAKKAVKKAAATKHAAASDASTSEAPKGSGQSASNAVDEQLARYRSMRDFHVTAEPSGGPKAAGSKESNRLPFCIQKHAASHLHYDFRLGWNGVLKSWAVAKGPSYVTADKRLAVQVEDHPMEYGGFEGIIPKGQYGGGTVMLWDQGWWEPQAAYPDVNDGLRKGSLKFILHGTKMQGKWALIRMGGTHAGSSSKPNWLLIKEHDDFERTPTDPAVADAEPKSVITGRTMEQIAANEDHVWNSKDTAKESGTAWYRQESKTPNTDASPGGRPKNASKTQRARASPGNLPDVSLLKKEVQPEFLAPQLAQQAESPPASDGWVHELKLDGYRVQARRSGSKVTLLTRKGLDWTHRMPDLAAEIVKLPVDSATLDGEVVVLASDGNTSFADLQAAFQNDARHHLTYFVFDLLHLNGRNPRDLTLIERKALLAEMMSAADADTLRVSEHLEGDGMPILHRACQLHAEGIISKRAAARYCAGRSSDWIKCKCLLEQELVIGGFTLPGAGHAGMHGIGALLLGYYEGGKLIYAGRTGTGFNQKTHAMLRDKLEALAQATTAFERPPAEARRGAHWVSPTLVAQVRFATWTADRLVRQAAFLGLREDKPAEEVVRETSAPTPRSPKGGTPSKTPENGSPARSNGVMAVRPAPAARPLDHPPIRLTHPNKILDPLSNLTKQQLADYYWAVAERMLPHVAERPLSLVRCPEGSGSPCFFQKHVNHMLPKGIGSVPVADKKGVVEPYITLNNDATNREALAGLAQMGVLEVHPWGSRNDDLERPDRLTLDLDPDESLPWTTVAGAAADVRARLKKLGLTSFLKTTGGKGLHVVIPVTPALEWPAAKEWAHRFVLGMEKANPRLYLTKMTKAARTNRIYLDYLRNERGATAVAPYSPRARAGAGVSMPLAWTEIARGPYATERPVFAVAEFAEWRERLRRDPWKEIGGVQQELLASV